MLDAARTQNRSIAVGQTLNWRWPWSYNRAKSGRDGRLDLLRGFCLFVMAIDHIGVFGPDSWLYLFTGKGEFFISAAEGFVFISGLVMGIVYCKVIAKEGLNKAVSKILNRVVKLYWLTVGLSLFFTALALWTPLKLWAERDWIQIKDPIEIVIGSLTLHYAFHGSSIMVMYVMFLALAPLVFYLMTQGKTWLVLAVSWLIWAGNIFYPNQFSVPFESNFPFAAWQVLFVTALALGYHREKLAKFFRSRAQWQTSYYVAVSLTALAMLAFFILDRAGLIQQTFINQPENQWIMQNLEDKGNLPLLRLFGVFLFFQAFYLLVTWLWVPIQKALGWFLIPIGEAGLYVFSLHLVLIVLVYNLPGFTNLPYLLYGLAELLAVSLLWIAVKTRFLYNIIPR